MWSSKSNNYIYYRTYKYNHNTARSRGRISNQVIGTMASTFKQLINAVRDGDEVECARVLELQNADIHKKDNNGRSSIIHASYHGHVNVVELLLSKGANISDKANDGRSSIIHAS